MSSNDVSEFDSFLTFEQCMCLLVGKGLEGSTSKVCGGSCGHSYRTSVFLSGI